MISSISNVRSPATASRAVAEQRQESDYRNPPQIWRMACVGACFAMPGCLAGLLVSAVFGPVVVLLCLGALVGVFAGMMLEGRN